MSKILNNDIAQLLSQLRFTPPDKRRHQIQAAQELFSILKDDAQYPIDFVIFRITGHRPKAEHDYSTLSGQKIKHDLTHFISALSSQIAQPAELQGEKVYSVEELSRHLKVSTKTIQRWRKKGLLAIKFIFSDDVKRLGFTQSKIDEFLAKNKNLFDRASSFERLGDNDRDRIINLARKFATNENASPRSIIARVARETGKAHETVRYTIANYEKRNSKTLFANARSMITPTQAGEMFRLYQQGARLNELTKKFNRNKSSIFRIIKIKRAKAMLAHKLDYIHSEEFSDTQADEILKQPLEEIWLPKKSDEKKLKTAAPMNRELETDLFRRYNYLKYLLLTQRSQIKPSNVSAHQINRLELYFEQAESIKNIIIEANMNLVTAIARKHLNTGAALQDLVSEGNYSLLKAAEKFDYTRGVRFSTYASWAITRDFARKIPHHHAASDQQQSEALEELHKDMRMADAVDFRAIETAHDSLAAVIRSELNDREQYVIINHYGLEGSLIRKTRKTLKQIGEDLGLSKERVRQIELIALQKLRQTLSLEQFELLTG